MSRYIAFALVALLVCIALPPVTTLAQEQRILHVPGDFPTIQQAIDNAISGDKVIVADGTYKGLGNKDLDYGGKSITVQSEKGPENCIIDCEGSGRGFNFDSGETNAAIVEGFTIRNGNVSDAGGAIRCEHASPTVISCVMIDNTGHYGGAISCIGSAPRIYKCIMKNNSTSDLFLGYGGAVYGLVFDGILSECVIADNKAAWGGAMRCAWSEALVTQCRIENNTATFGGGGIFVNGWETMKIANCLVSKNSSKYGAGIYAYYQSPPSIKNCTIASNSASESGGGLSSVTANPVLDNTIIWGNTAPTGNEIFTSSSDSTVTLNYCDYADNTLNPNNIKGLGTVSHNDCIHEDPLFISVADSNYRLQVLSPCVDAGSNDLVPPSMTKDLDGKDRIVDGVVDIGAYEYQVLDTTPPEITILSPVDTGKYAWSDSITVDFAVNDPESGVASTIARIDCNIIEDDQQILSSELTHGNHFMLVKAVNGAGLESQHFITFHTSCEPTDMKFVVVDGVQDGLITNEGIGQSLIAKLDHIDGFITTGDVQGTLGRLHALQNELNAQAGKKIDVSFVAIAEDWIEWTQAETIPLPDTALPTEMRYDLSSDSRLNLVLPDGSSLSHSLDGESTYIFEATENPDIMRFTVPYLCGQSGPFQIDGHSIVLRYYDAPVSPPSGTVDMVTGSVKGKLTALFELEVDGITDKPFMMTMDIVGVQQWPDFATAKVITCRQATLPEDTPYVGGYTVVFQDRQDPQPDKPPKQKWSQEITDVIDGQPRKIITITKYDNNEIELLYDQTGNKLTLTQADSSNYTCGQVNFYQDKNPPTDLCTTHGFKAFKDPEEFDEYKDNPEKAKELARWCENWKHGLPIIIESIRNPAGKEEGECAHRVYIQLVKTEEHYWLSETGEDNSWTEYEDWAKKDEKWRVDSGLPKGPSADPSEPLWPLYDMQLRLNSKVAFMFDFPCRPHPWTGYNTLLAKDENKKYKYVKEETKYEFKSWLMCIENDKAKILGHYHWGFTLTIKYEKVTKKNATQKDFADKTCYKIVVADAQKPEWIGPEDEKHQNQYKEYKDALKRELEKYYNDGTPEEKAKRKPWVNKTWKKYAPSDEDLIE